MLTHSQILILKLLFYFPEPATEHVILAPGYPRKSYITNKSNIPVYVWHVSYYCRFFLSPALMALPSPHTSLQKIEVKLCNSLKWGNQSEEDQTYRKEPTRTYRSFQGVSQCSQLAAKRPSAATRSIAAGRLGLPELEREPRRHISEERSREKLREHRSQPIVKEYDEFHLLLN